VPIPVWYPLDENGEADFDNPILPSVDQLPVDPASDAAPGYDESQRGVPGGFRGEIDIMDTWATSSLTPELAGGWLNDPDLFAAVYPYDLRPQGQDIIRTWLFSTLLRSELERGTSPWKNAALSGFILDPDRKKMSKSKGSVSTPADILAQHGSDAVRYWAASSRLGTDAAFDPQNPTQIKIGRRLAIKILNAAKFILSFPVAADATPTAALDLSMLDTLAQVVTDVTAALDGYDHARALEIAEPFFWTFCDDYLELVKERAYGSEGVTDAEQASAVAALRIALSTLLRLFAPVVPFATAEAWSWFNSDSVHLAAWPTAHGVVPEADGLPSAAARMPVLAVAGHALIGIRRAKTDAKVSQKAAVSSATISGTEEQLEALALAANDLKAVGRIAELTFVAGPKLSVTDIVLAPVQEA
jgi:valyl-tRNA synthetase